MHEGFQQDPVDRPAPARWTPGSRPHQCGSPTNRCRGGGNPPCSTHAAAAQRGGAPPRARLGWLCCSCALRTTSNPPLLPLSSLQSRASDRHYSTLWPTDDGHRAEALPPVAGAQLPMRHGRKRGLPTREEGTRGAGILLSVALRGIAALCREHRPSGLTHTHATLVRPLCRPHPPSHMPLHHRPQHGRVQVQLHWDDSRGHIWQAGAAHCWTAMRQLSAAGSSTCRRAARLHASRPAQACMTPAMQLEERALTQARNSPGEG